jgi:hypothetical protein
MSGRNVVTLIIAACGLLGLVTVRLVEITPTPVQKAIIVAVAILLLIGVSAIRRYKPHRGQDELRSFMRNPARRGRKPWVVTDKTFLIDVPDQGGLRRDASLDVTVLLHNRSRRSLANVEFPIAGDSRVRPGDLEIAADIDGSPTHIDVRYVDGNSPIVVVPMPTPGLSRGEKASIRLRWTWPGMANMRGGTWMVSMTNVQSSSSVRIELNYPADHPQIAEVRLVKSLAGFQWDVPKGSLSPKLKPTGWCFELEHSKGRLDSLVCIDMGAKQESPAGADVAPTSQVP